MSWVDDCRTRCCDRKSTLDCAIIGYDTEPGTCTATLEYAWDCGTNVWLKCRYKKKGYRAADCEHRFEYTYRWKEIEEKGDFENWAMNNNQMKLYDYYYYKNHPEYECKNEKGNSSMVNMDVTWQFCDGREWDGVTNADCWIEKSDNGCGTVLCKKWDNEFDTASNKWQWKKSECPLSDQEQLEKNIRDGALKAQNVTSSFNNTIEIACPGGACVREAAPAVANTT